MSSFPRTDGLEDLALTPQELLQQMEAEPGSLILTASARSARFLSRQYALLQHNRGIDAWPAPRILPWETWLSSLWDAAIRLGIDDRLLISEAQEFELWRTAVAGSSAASLSLHTPENLAKLAADAWREMQRYAISSVRLRSGLDVDTRAFREWADTVQAAARRGGMLLYSLVEHAASLWIEDARFPLPPLLFLTGFDRLVPAQQTILATLSRRGSSVRCVTLRAAAEESVSPRLYTASSSDAEITAAAEWARAHLERNPRSAIGILGSFDTAARTQVERRFREILASETLDLQNAAKLPYEFSLGQPMQTLVPVRTALLLLRWAAAPLSAEEASWLLLHGAFTQAPTNSAVRAHLDLKFRRRQYQSGGSIFLPAFLDWLQRTDPKDQFRNPLRALLQAARTGSKQQRRSMPEWRATIDECLQAAQWQLLNPVGSHDFQLLRRWDALLDRLASLGATTAAMTYADAMDRLEWLAAETLFAEESQDAPVQILGAAEAAGMTFDAVWCMQVSAAEFPPPGRVQPFLPWSVQREARMPHTGAIDLAFAEQLTQRIVASANEVVLSFALGPNDDASSGELPELLLSPAVRAVLKSTPLELLPTKSISTDSAVGPPLETVSEEPCVTRDSLSVEGGVRFLERQAECPFRAFAEIRLGSAPVEELESGLASRTQGTFIHHVLEHYWKQTKTRAQLAAQLAAGELPGRLRALIDAAMEPFIQGAEQPWQREALALENRRLQERLLAWLTFEADRPDFSVLDAEEKLGAQQIAGVSFNCIIDRIDRVEAGIALIDYKTRVSQKSSCWDGERPEAPQLPVYAALLSQRKENQPPIAGVALAALEPTKLGFPVAVSIQGVFDNDPPSDKPSSTSLQPEEMAGRIAEWSATLENLAGEFLRGVAILDPRDGKTTCRRCDQRLLCRITETELEEQLDADAEDSEKS
jgi:ATP-dependent helicase/nuclease subunit B